MNASFQRQSNDSLNFSRMVLSLSIVMAALITLQACGSKSNKPQPGSSSNVSIPPPAPAAAVSPNITQVDDGKMIRNQIQSWGTRFIDMNWGFGGTISNPVRKQMISDGVCSFTSAGGEPRKYFENAYGTSGDAGSYLGAALNEYEKKGRTIIPEDALPSLTPSTVIYEATRGSDVPTLKDEVAPGLIIHLVLDSQTVASHLSRLGRDNFVKVYGEEPLVRELNPAIETKEEKDPATGEVSRVAVAKRLDPAKPIYLHTPKSVVAKFEAGEWQDFLNRRSGFSRTENRANFFDNVGFQTFNSLEEMTDYQLNIAEEIYISPDQFVALEGRLTRPTENRITNAQATSLSGFVETIYQICPGRDKKI